MAGRDGAAGDALRRAANKAPTDNLQSSVLLSSLELSDTKVYEADMRGLLNGLNM